MRRQCGGSAVQRSEGQCRQVDIERAIGLGCLYMASDELMGHGMVQYIP